jgi:hypothetical protein
MVIYLIYGLCIKLWLYSHSSLFCSARFICQDTGASLPVSPTSRSSLVVSCWGRLISRNDMLAHELNSDGPVVEVFYLEEIGNMLETIFIAELSTPI